MAVKKYEPDFIFKFKEKYFLSKCGIEKLEKINNIMVGSTDNKNFKIKIKNQEINLNSNKWYRKRFITNEEKIKKKINGLLNKLSDKNYKEIINNILKLKISSFEIMDFLMCNIFNKTIFESNYIEYWMELIKEVTLKNLKKWNFNNTLPYKIFLNYCQEYFEKLLIDYNLQDISSYQKDDIEIYHKKKKLAYGFIILISELHKINFINLELLNAILNELIKDKEEIYKLELGVFLCSKISENNDYEYISNFLNDLKGDSNTCQKIKFLIMDIFDKDQKDEYVEKSLEDLCNETINFYVTNNNIDSSFDKLLDLFKNYKQKQIFYYFFLYSIENINNINYPINLIKKNLKRKKVNYQTIKISLHNFLLEYDDFKIDLPDINDRIIILFNKLNNNKILNINTLNYIVSNTLSEKNKTDLLNKFENSNN